MEDMHQHYNILLVALSYAVSVLGAYTALQMALGIPLAQSNGRRLLEVVAAGTAMGGGAIWAMHFIAMLACDIGAPTQFDPTFTAASAVLAAASCSLGLWIVATRGTGPANLALAGILMGIGVAGMHYLGMAAVESSVGISYDTTLVALSVVIAIVASIVALWLAFNLRGVTQMLGSALVMAVAVCGMHYTGMAAAILTAGAGQMLPGEGLDANNLGLIIFGVVTLLLVAALGLSIVRQQRRAALTI